MIRLLLPEGKATDILASCNLFLNFCSISIDAWSLCRFKPNNASKSSLKAFDVDLRDLLFAVTSTEDWYLLSFATFHIFSMDASFCFLVISVTFINLLYV